MKRKALLLEHVPEAVKLVSVSVALALAACSSVHPSTDASAGQTAGGAAASSGSSNTAQGGDGEAGRRSDGEAASGGAGGRASLGAAGSSSRAGGANAAGGAGAPGSSLAPLGGPCETSADCGMGLLCLQSASSDLDGGGPANGLCTSLCDTDADCSPLEAGAGCFGAGLNGYCFQACTQGTAANLASKCNGRPDFACAAFDTGAFCLPLCRADVECGANRFCNRASGLCQATKAPGDPVGAACDPAATTSSCLGTCLRTSADGVSPVTGVCVELCSGGLECMWDDAGSKPGGFCAGPLSDSFGALDIGFCFPSCECSGECPTFGSQCRAWTNAQAELQSALGKPGLCYDNVEGSNELSCP